MVSWSSESPDSAESSDSETCRISGITWRGEDVVIDPCRCCTALLHYFTTALLHYHTGLYRLVGQICRCLVEMPSTHFPHTDTLAVQGVTGGGAQGETGVGAVYYLQWRLSMSWRAGVLSIYLKLKLQNSNDTIKNILAFRQFKRRLKFQCFSCIQT